MSKLPFMNVSALLQKFVSVSVFLLLSSIIVNGQNVWESFGTSSSPWGLSKDLTSYGNTTTKVDIRNLNFRSEEEKRNKVWRSEDAWINLTSYNETPVDIAFNVRNVIPSNLSNIYYPGEKWFWSVEIDYTTTTGQNKYFRLNYSTEKYSNSRNTYQSSCTNDNGVQSDWEKVTSIDNRRFRILFDDNQIKIYNNRGDNLAKTIYGVKKLRYVQVGAGPGTELEITNTSCQKMTIYGQSLPYLRKAGNYLENNNASSAANEMTTAINKGLKCYDTYFMRGVAYYMQGFYKSAIEDLTSAISYYASNKELAYYYRGLSKLALDDDYGINDLKNGGQDGIVFLREHNLMNYTPGQKKKTTTKKSSSSTQPKKPTLKK